MFTIKDTINNMQCDRIRLATIGNRGFALVRWSEQASDPDSRKAGYAIYHAHGATCDPVNEDGIVMTAGELKQLADAIQAGIQRGDIADTISIEVHEHCKRQMEYARQKQTWNSGRGW